MSNVEDILNDPSTPPGKWVRAAMERKAFMEGEPTLVSDQWQVAHNALKERFISFLDFIEDHTADRSIIGRVLREREAL